MKPTQSSTPVANDTVNSPEIFRVKVYPKLGAVSGTQQAAIGNTMQATEDTAASVEPATQKGCSSRRALFAQPVGGKTVNQEQKQKALQTKPQPAKVTRKGSSLNEKKNTVVSKVANLISLFSYQ